MRIWLGLLLLGVGAGVGCSGQPERVQDPGSESASASSAFAVDAAAPAATPSERQAPTQLLKPDVKAAAMGKTKAELRALYGAPDVAGEYEENRDYWTYWAARLPVVDPDTGRIDEQGTTFKFIDGQVYEVAW